jgi:glycine/D-amino acid oxidase-like deaminating enzyme
VQRSSHPCADAVVIGGGIIGVACAFALTAEGLAVHLVERDFPCSGTSRACDGLILLWDKEPGPALELGRLSAALWMRWMEAAAADCAYEQHGCLLVAEDEATFAQATARQSRLAAHGVPGEVLTGRDLRSLEPNLAPDLAGAVFFPNEAQVDPRRATVAWLQAARSRGLAWHTHAPVLGIDRTCSGALGAVRTAQGRIAAEQVVIAAGVWSAEVAALAGVSLPVRPRRGHILVTEPLPGFIHHPMLEARYTATLHHRESDEQGPPEAEHSLLRSFAPDLQVAFVAENTAAGPLLLGSSREFVGFDRTVARPVLQAVATRARRFLPRLAQAQILRSYAGLRPFSPDGRPLLGPVRDVPGLFVATGHEGAGICLAPATGHLIAQWLTGQPLALDPEPFRPDRLERTSEKA